MVRPCAVKGRRNEPYKILSDFTIQTDHVREHRRSDVVVLDKHEKMCHLIDIAVPRDSSVLSIVGEGECTEISGFSERTS